MTDKQKLAKIMKSKTNQKNHFINNSIDKPSNFKSTNCTLYNPLGE